MNNLTVVTTQKFGTVLCDFYRNESNDIFMTRDQIGTALEYENPRDAIYRIHERNADRLDKYSAVVKLSTTDGKAYSTYIYSTKGIYEICRFSRQPKADAFMDWVWDVIESIRNSRSRTQFDLGDRLDVVFQSWSPVNLHGGLYEKIRWEAIRLNKTINSVAEKYILAGMSLSELITDELNKKIPETPEISTQPKFGVCEPLDWKSSVKHKIDHIAEEAGLAEPCIRGHLYRDLEEEFNVNLKARVVNLKARMKKAGATYREQKAVSKIDAIACDRRLKKAFEEVLQSHLNGEW